MHKVPCESQSVMLVASCAVKVAMDGAVVAAVAVVPAGKTSLWTRVTIDMSIEVLVVLDLSVGVLTSLSIDAAINALNDVAIDVLVDPIGAVIVDMLAGVELIVVTAVVTVMVVALELIVPVYRGIEILPNVAVGELINIDIAGDFAADVLTVMTPLKCTVPTFLATFSSRAAFECLSMAALYCDRVLRALKQSSSGD